MNPVSLVLVTHNEERRIRAWLGRILPHVSELVWIDQASTDRTIDEAVLACKQNLIGDFIFYPHPRYGFSEASNPAALAAATREWVLVGFPDETFTDDFLAALPALTANASVDGYYLKRDNIIGGKPWLLGEHCMRLLRRSWTHVVPLVHNDPVCQSPRRVWLDYLCILHDKTMEEQHADNVRYRDLGLTAGRTDV